ncbi:hypothetical protein [Nonomuraea sp. NPDC048916]|uniref:hypothetical protein n=1 Tax=Nonomuraea sp. NPDC048916 TaxID=3154232 RepID=UPI0034088C17
MSQGEQDVLASRLAHVEQDRHRLQDIQRVRILGGELQLPLVAEGRCPTCQQDLDSRSVETGTVSTVEDNLSLLDAERSTLLNMQASAEIKAVNLASSVAATESRLSEARDRVRLLRDELVGPSNLPSLAEVQERLFLESRLSGAERLGALIGAIDEALDSLALRLDDVRTRRARLGESDSNPRDRVLLRSFRSSFQQQLSAYGLRSLSPAEVTIDERTLLPINDGFELSFDVALGISASDAIRTKWAYHTALLEAAFAHEEGRHLGFLILDEPRQQETDRRSLEAFLQRLHGDSGLGQVIYATSEESSLLNILLQGIPHNKLPAHGSHLLQLG